MKKNIGLRLLIAITIILIVITIFIRTILDAGINASKQLINEATIMFALYIVLVVFTLTFLLILARNIFKLYFSKAAKGNFPGKYSFRRKLISFFISFSIIPSILIFLLATDIANRGIKKVFNADIEKVISKSQQLQTSYYEKSQHELKHFSATIISKIRKIPLLKNNNPLDLKNKLTMWMKEYQLDAITIYVHLKEICSMIKPGFPLKDYKDLSTKELYKALSGGDFIKIDTFDKGELIRCGMSFSNTKGENVLIITGKYYPDTYIKDLKKLNSLAERYEQIQSVKNPVKNSYVLLFILLTILVVFASSWVGYYLAKGVTTPIKELIDAFERLKEGDLSVTFRNNSSSEFSALSNVFNNMVKRFKKNEEKFKLKNIEIKHKIEMTENILQNISSGVIAINSKGEIIEFNKESSKILGLNRKKCKKKHFSTIFSNEQFIEIYEAIKDSYSLRQNHTLERKISIKNKGRIRNLSIKTVLRGSNFKGDFRSMLIIITDNTQLLKAQQTMVWSEIARRIAHEIKNPLTPIQISAQRILNSEELSDEKFRKITESSLSVILEEVDSIKKLSEEFANFSRMPVMHFSKGDINHIIDNLLKAYKVMYKNIKFQTSLDIEIPIINKMDTEQVRRVLVNILDNAIEAMKEKGLMEIKTSYIKETQFIKVEIADNGPGVPDSEKPKLFIPYYSSKSSGTGLGLAIANKIIEEHNGKISLMDNKKQGAVFIIELPIS